MCGCNNESKHSFKPPSKSCNSCHQCKPKCAVVECKPKHENHHHNTYCDSRMSCKANVVCHLATVGSSKEVYIRRYHLENVHQQSPCDC